MDIQAYIQSGVIESYVLGICSAEEMAEVELLATQHEAVQEAINNFSDRLEQEALVNAVQPPVNVKEKLFSTLFNTPIDANLTALTTETAPLVQMPAYTLAEDSVPQLRSAKWQWIAAAAIILFVVSSGANYYLYNRYSDTRNQYQALLTERNTLQASNNIYQTKLQDWQNSAAMMGDPKMLMVKMPGVATRKENMAYVFWDTQSKDVYLMANKLPQPASGKQYQLWALVDGKPVDAGMLDPTCTSTCKMKNIPRAQAFAITLEKSGGSPSPSMDQMYVMGSI